MNKLNHPSDTFYKYPELYQLRDKTTGRKLLNCASRSDCERELARVKRVDWKLAKNLVIIKLDRKEELSWQTKTRN